MVELPELGSITRMRKALRMTQTELARRAGVSQSLIARIESGTVDPAYSKVARIYSALAATKDGEITGEHIMSHTVYFVEPTDSLKAAIHQMREHGVSQMPVIEGKKQVGSISEDVLLDQISRGANIKTLSQKKVADIMDDPFPQVKPGTGINTISALLKTNRAVLMTERGEIKGIVSNADLLKVLHV